MPAKNNTNELVCMDPTRPYQRISPLGIALLQGQHDRARALLQQGADPNHGAVDRYTPLNRVFPLLPFLCAQPTISLPVLRFLVEAGADLERRMVTTMCGGGPGVTALQLAYWRGDSIDAVCLLLLAGADPRNVDLEMKLDGWRIIDRVVERQPEYAGMAQAGPLIKAARHEPKRLRLLHKARACHDTAAAVAHVVETARKAGEISPEMDSAAAAVQLRERCAAKAPEFVRSRLLRGEAPPRCELTAQGVEGAEKVWVVMEFVVSGAFCPEHFVELKEMLAPKWYDPLEG